jgi:dTDP-4-dehydrorhamnose 3,5-epimerase
MKVFETKFKDVKLLIPTVYQDDRGFFTESYNQEVEDLLNVNFLQDNHSKSKKYVIRGLHYQWDNPMGKLLRVVSGAGIDTVVDIRKDSPTYGQHETFSLTDENFHMLWVPPGFAQGFLATQEDTHLCYKTTALHNGDSEGSIHPTNSGLDIYWWGIPNEHIILSEKDKTAQTFNDYDKQPKFY